MFESPLGVADALDRVQSWLDHPNVILLAADGTALVDSVRAASIIEGSSEHEPVDARQR